MKNYFLNLLTFTLASFTVSQAYADVGIGPMTMLLLQGERTSSNSSSKATSDGTNYLATLGATILNDEDLTKYVNAYLAKYPVPSDPKELLAYEAGFVANMCTVYPGWDFKSDCFSAAVKGSRYHELQEATKACDKMGGAIENVPVLYMKKVNCYSDAYMSIHNKFTAPQPRTITTPQQSCESKLANLQQRLESLDSRVMTGDRLKQQVDSIVQELEKSASPVGATQ